MSLFPTLVVSVRLRHTLAACAPDLHRHGADPWVIGRGASYRDQANEPRVRIEETVAAYMDGLAIPIPSEAEPRRLLRLFGRDKHLQRADRLVTRKHRA